MYMYMDYGMQCAWIATKKNEGNSIAIFVYWTLVHSEQAMCTLWPVYINLQILHFTI